RGVGAALSSVQTLTALYSNQSDFHDITSGKSGSNSAHAGYDQVTGLGTPIAQQLVQRLVTAPAVKAAAVPISTTNANRTSGANGSRSATGADVVNPTQSLAFFLSLGTQPVSFGSVTTTQAALLALPVTAGAVFVPPSFTSTSTSNSSGSG